jgi:hypothetical protein
MSAPWSADAPATERTLAFFEGLSASTLSLVDLFYADDVHFEDPMVSLRGRTRLRAYYASIYRNEPELRWEFEEPIDRDSWIALGWTMHLRVRGLAAGRPLAVAGLSRLRFDGDGRCAYHRDYFDMGAFVYEHVPVLGRVIRLVKQRLHGPDFGPADFGSAEE